MKTRILKTQLIAMMAFMIFSAPTPSITTPPAEIINEVHTLNEDQLFEKIVLRIKTDGVDEMLKLAKIFTTPALLDKERNLDSIIERCKTRLTILENTILEPLKLKLDLIKRNSPSSPFLPLYENTYKFVKDDIYNDLCKMLTQLEAHRKSADMKSAIKLKKIFGPFGEKFASDSLQKTLEAKLNGIYALAQKLNASIVKRLNKDEVINSVKKQVQEIATGLKPAAILTAWGSLLKRS